MRLYRDSMSERAMSVMRAQGWLSAMEIGDQLSLPAADVTSERNTLSRALIRLCDAKLIERRTVGYTTSGSRYEFRAIDPAQPRAE